jgi:hypothetical protein
MASLTHTYTDTLTDNRPATPQVRTGGPRHYFQAAPANERFGHDVPGSHMPIDTSIHWEWRNPINILPAIILVFLAIAVLAMVLA